MAKARELLQWSKAMTAGSGHLEAGKFAEACADFTQAVEKARHLAQNELIGFSLRLLGVALNRTGAYAQALTAFAESLDFARETGNLRAQAEALAGLATVHAALEHLELADKLFNESLSLFVQVDEPLRQAMVLCDLGNLQCKAELWDKAWQAYDHALQVCRRQGEKYAQGEIQVLLGELSRRQDNLEHCAIHLLAAAMLFAGLAEKRSLASTLQYLGLTYHEMGETTQAIVTHRRALEIWLELGDHQEAALVLLALGKMVQTMGDFAAAETYILRSLELVKDDPEAAAYRQQSLGDLYLMSHDLKQAEHNFPAALVFFKAAGKTQLTSDLLETLGLIREISRDWFGAENYYLEALSNLPAGNQLRRAELLRTLGLLYAGQGQNKKALSQLWSALAIFRSLASQEADKVEQEIQYISYRIRRGN